MHKGLILRKNCKVKIFHIFLILIFGNLFMPTMAFSESEEVQWISPVDKCVIDGLPWIKENQGKFIRLPQRAKLTVSEGVWNLACQPSGARIRFKTDSTMLKLKIQHGSENGRISMHHMSSVAVSGIDLYEGVPGAMDFWASNNPKSANDVYESTYFKGIPEKEREFTLYLPSYNKLSILEIGLDSDANIKPPSDYKLTKPIVFYGTSITQSGCASRGSNGFVPVVGRRLGVDVVNFGFSGNGLCEPELADLISEVDACCYIIDPVANMNPSLMEERYDKFIAAVRAKRPRIPIVLMTRIHYANEIFFGTEYSDKLNQYVFDTYNRLRNSGDSGIYLFDSSKVICPGGDHPSVDGVHLTDIGFDMLATELVPVLKDILSL